MSTIIGLFSDSNMAGTVVGDLKAQGFTDDISVIAKDVNQPRLTSEQVKQDVTDGSAVGAAAGATLGAIGALLTGVASFAVPGIGFVVLGPLATLLAGTAGGAVAGSIVGALVDWGIPEQQAKDFEHRINSGEILVAVTAHEEHKAKIQGILASHGASETYVAE